MHTCFSIATRFYEHFLSTNYFKQVWKYGVNLRWFSVSISFFYPWVKCVGVFVCMCSSTTLITVIVFFIENTWRQFKYDIFAVIFLLYFFSSSLERIEAQTQVHPHVSVYELLTKKDFSIHLPFFAKSYFYTYKLPILIEKKKRILHQNRKKIAQNCVGFIQILIYMGRNGTTSSACSLSKDMQKSIKIG